MSDFYLDILKIIEPELNKLKQRISLLESYIEDIQAEHQRHWDISKHSLLINLAATDTKTELLNSNRICSQCAMSIYNGFYCVEENCPMGLHEK